MINEPFSKRLKDERKRLGLSQEEVAQKVSVHRETWSRYENDKITPGSSILFYAAKLGFDINYIMTGVRQTPAYNIYPFRVAEEGTAYKVNGLTKSEQELLELYRSANNEGKKTIEDIARLVAANNTD